MTKQQFTLFLTMVLAFGSIAQVQNKSNIDWTKMSNNKDVSFYEIQSEFNRTWENRTPKKGEGYKVFKRWEERAAPRVFPSGDLSLLASNYENFLEWQAKYSTRRSLNGDWKSLNANSTPTGYDVGAGRVNFVTFDPIDSNTMFVGTPDGGLWKTTNGGVSWTTNTDLIPIIGCSGLVIDSLNTQHMYLATGDNGDDRRSIGVLKSTDGGSTWVKTGLVWTAADNYKIRKIIMDPKDSKKMFIATDGGVFRTTDGWETSTQVGNIEIFSDLEFKPFNSNVIYASSEYGVYFSNDNGVTWTASTGIPSNNNSRIELAVTAGDDAYVYAIVGDHNYGFKGLYQSKNSGTSFTLRSSTPNILHANADPQPLDTGGQANHDLAITVSPSDPDFVTIGGINQWQSTDAGANWYRITYWLGKKAGYEGEEYEPEPYIHADIQFQAYLPGSNTTMFATCDGGISRSRDEGQTWTDITNNLAIGQQTNIALSSLNKDLFIVGLQDIGSTKYKAGTYTVISGGDGEDGFIDRTNDQNIVSSTVNGEFFLSKDGGISNDGKITGLPDGEWFSPIHQDPVNANLIYVGGFPELYKSTNLFTATNYTWTKLGSPAGTGNIQRFEIAASKPSTIYAIKTDKVSVSKDGGTTWSDISNNLPLTNAQVKNLAVSATDENKVWVVFSGYSDGDKVYKTEDGGSTWVNISSNLPNLPINCIVEVKGDINEGIYIGADLGVYYLDKFTTDWVLFTNNLPNVAITDLEIFYGTNEKLLRAATYGRGAWESDMYENPVKIEEIETTENFVVYPNPVTDKLIIETSKTNIQNYSIVNIHGQEVLSGKLELKTVINVSDLKAGHYFIKLESGEEIEFKKIIKQ